MATVDFVMNIISKRLKNDVAQVLRTDVAELLDNELRTAIKDTVYAEQEGDSYERSMGLLNSVTHNVYSFADYYIIRAYNEPSLMSWSPKTEHSSWVDGADIRKNLPFWMARGHTGIVNYTPANYDILATKKLRSEKKYLKLLKTGLKLKGYKVT